MALVADEERPGTLYAIMGCFTGYKFQSGGIYRIGTEPGNAAEKVIDLPFAHRIDLVHRGNNRFLIAATLAADKSEPSDWSRPGSLYASRVPRQKGEGWSLVPVLEGIHRNHGLLVARFMGRRSVLVSGTEGLFAADLDASGGDWGFRQLMSQEISEIAVSDVDGDGTDELITIEPFHGNYVRLYKLVSGQWRKVWEAELDFGHCVVAGKINGAQSVLVSNRAGSRDLLLFQFSGNAARAAAGIAEPLRYVVDPGAGAANMLVMNHNGTDGIFATNQAAGELVCYVPMTDAG
jgi:hypothetical protein